MEGRVQVSLPVGNEIYAFTGDKEKAQGKIEEMLALRKCRYVSPYNLALVYTGLGDAEFALQWLEPAFEERDAHMTFLLDSKRDGIRSNERFQQLLSLTPRACFFAKQGAGRLHIRDGGVAHVLE